MYRLVNKTNNQAVDTGTLDEMYDVLYSIKSLTTHLKYDNKLNRSRRKLTVYGNRNETVYRIVKIC
jgi:ribosomal protein S15P/S13E